MSMNRIDWARCQWIVAIGVLRLWCLTHFRMPTGGTNLIVVCSRKKRTAMGYHGNRDEPERFGLAAFLGGGGISIFRRYSPHICILGYKSDGSASFLTLQYGRRSCSTLSRFWKGSEPVRCEL